MYRTFFVFILLLCAHVQASPNHSFNIAGTSVAPNSRADIKIPISMGANDPATFIPVTIINGRESGPVVAAVAGIHGFEYASILAVAEWVDTIDTETLKGTVIAVRAAHISSFEARAPYVNPFDRKNLNRSFPGNPKGTQTERIAWAISQHIVAPADFLLDLHSGDGAEWLAPFVGAYGGPLSSDYELSLAVAKNFGFPNVITYEMHTQAQVDKGRSLNRQGVAAKVPTVLVEIGENGKRDRGDIDKMKFGLHQTLATLSMTNSTVQPHQPERVFSEAYYPSVKHSGIWHPTKVHGGYVAKGEVLGEVKDYFGNTLETVVAPEAGYALYGLAGPPIRAGESVMTIAVE